MSKLPYPESMARAYPPGTTPDRRRIIRCSNPKAWYADKVGKTITVHYFVTFGCWDTQGRWLDYYDLSMPIEYLEQVNKWMAEETGRIRKAKDEMNKWPDIPMSWQYGSLCEILNIKSDKAGMGFCIGLLIRPETESAQMLYDIRKHEFSEPPVKKSWFKKLFK